MPTLNPFSADAFNMYSLTNAINILPNNYGRIRELGIFKTKRVSTVSVMVEELNGVLNLLPTQPRGAPGTVGKHPKRKMRSFTVPHIPHDDVILAASYQDVREFGSENQLTGIASIVNDRLQAMKNKHAITLEHLRVGALQGVILDSDASEIYDLYDEFDITKKTVDFVLGTTATNVPEKCREAVRWIESHLLGETKSGIRAFVDESWFDKFIKHTTVKEAYLYHSAAQNMIGGDVRKGFKFCGITFEEYSGTATDPDGTARKFIANDYGIAYPEGTMDMFQTIFAPADFNETVNTLGKELYAKQKVRDYDRGVDIHTQSNPLPMCNRPGALVELYTSN